MEFYAEKNAEAYVGLIIFCDIHVILMCEGEIAPLHLSSKMGPGPEQRLHSAHHHKGLAVEIIVILT